MKKIKNFLNFIFEGQNSKTVKSTGVKYILDDDIDELIKICELIYDPEELPKDELEPDILEYLEILEFEHDIDLVYFGDCISNSRNNPMGVILTPTNNFAKNFLLNILKNIGSIKKIQKHTEICIM